MIIRKLAVPLINEKILMQAEHCYIATAAVTDDGFEFIRSRIPAKTKIDIVTGLDGLTSPAVLHKILRNYQGRINLGIYTKNVLHANLYLFDLPYRKSVAFTGSGTLSLNGLKDHEELFWKVTDPKEVESLMSWYTTYFQFSVPLTEEIVNEYELLYPTMMSRQIRSRREKDDLIVLTASSFRLDAVKFKNQFFSKDDYETFSSRNASYDNALLRMSRMAVREKLLSLHDKLKDRIAGYGLRLIPDRGHTIEPGDYAERKIDSMALVYSDKKEESAVTFHVRIAKMNLRIQACIENDPARKELRRNLLNDLNDPHTRSSFHGKVLRNVGDYTIEVAGVTKTVELLRQEQGFFDFLNSDPGCHFDMTFDKKFAPGDLLISNEKLADTILGQMKLLTEVFG
jgi:hypothetical protein